ncbi:MAG TPA: tetratricopeptide repeat protein [Patescibacteria group bacterium]|nr:tetratricopeptide repeat protein [Patescibacteria group bacterium]
MDSKKQALSYIENLSLIIVGVFFLAFPLVFTSISTDIFTTPKQALLFGFVILSTILLGAKMIIEGKVHLRTTPYDLPLLLFTLVLFASSLLAVNRYDSLISFVSLFFVIVAYFLIVNAVRGVNALLFILSCLVLGASLVGILAVLSFFKAYVLPFSFTHQPYFTPFGQLLDQAIFLSMILPLAGYFVFPYLSRLRLKREDSPFQRSDDVVGSTGRTASFSIAFIVIAAGLITTVFQLFTTQKPLILPLETGFQTGFAAVSQDTDHVFKSFLLGSGFGTYLTDFTRFKSAAYNAHPTLWSFTFFRSSSFGLELLATTGLFGVGAFFFILHKFIKERILFLPLVFAIVAALALPFSFTSLALLFLILAVFAVIRSHQDPKNYEDVEFLFVAVKNSLFGDGSSEKRLSRVVPALLLVILVAAVGFLGFYAGKYFYSDLLFKKALVAAEQNNGKRTYELQVQAINMFPYRDVYHRVFAQTNLALANALAQSVPKDTKPSEEVQKQILNLIQQGIQSGRNATTVSPQTALNWNNLSSIYRSLIGFGQNADQFAILTNQQAIALDATNPQQYINLGGIYYQLGQWEEAQRHFLQAITLKRDYANAYYNLGHTLEEKGDLQNALKAYQTVQSLVAAEPESDKKISEEIAVLQQKIGSQADSGTQVSTPESASQQEPIELNKSETQLPERKPPVVIPGPTVSIPSPTPSEGNEVTPSPEQ